MTRKRCWVLLSPEELALVNSCKPMDMSLSQTMRRMLLDQARFLRTPHPKYGGPKQVNAAIKYRDPYESQTTNQPEVSSDELDGYHCEPGEY